MDESEGNRELLALAERWEVEAGKWPTDRRSLLRCAAQLRAALGQPSPSGKGDLGEQGVMIPWGGPLNVVFGTTTLASAVRSGRLDPQPFLPGKLNLCEVTGTFHEWMVIDSKLHRCGDCEQEWSPPAGEQ